ncbi:MAG TPA: LUD domain-containing protein [Acidobacteriota bacterium]|nr:LUD domain-containing protein [Acidobacteriota bacterium]
MTAQVKENVERFRSALDSLGGTTRVLRSGFALGEAIDEIVRSQPPPPALLYEPFALADEMGLYLALRARGVDLVPVREAGDRAADMSVGLTGAELAIAESGTLIVGGQPGGWGLATVLPWVHIAVLRARDIVPDVAAAFEGFERRFAGGERNWVWISGPSRTADIVQELVKGIHGPNALHVFLVSDETGLA